MNRDESCCDHHWPSIFWLESRILCLLNSAVLCLCFVNISGSSCWRFWHSTQSDGGWVSLSDPAVVIHAKLLQCIHMIRLYVWFSSYTLSPSSFFAVCVCEKEGSICSVKVQTPPSSPGLYQAKWIKLEHGWSTMQWWAQARAHTRTHTHDSHE